MGAGLSFISEARAAYVALILREAGHGVLWEPNHTAHVIMTSASQAQVRELMQNNHGRIENWRNLPKVDCSKAKS